MKLDQSSSTKKQGTVIQFKKKMINNLKIGLVYFASTLVLSCSNSTQNGKKGEQHTLKFSNNFEIVVGENNELISINKVNKSDSISLSIHSHGIFAQFHNNTQKKEYSFSNNKGLYKIKTFLSLKDCKNYQNQIIYIDTLADNFLISDKSNSIYIRGLRDTVSLNELLVLNINLGDSIFPYFKIYIKKPDGELDFNKDNVLKSRDFVNSKSYFEKIKFTSKGLYEFKGFIENYTFTDDSMRASRTFFFNKHIYVR